MEYLLKDFLNREFVIGNTYVDILFAQKNNIVCYEDEQIVYPITIVNNICKSYERLFAILIESYSGIMPFWLAPVTVNIVATDEPQSVIKAKRLTMQLRKYKIYADLYLSKKGKIKKDSTVPYTIIIDGSTSSDKILEVASRDNKNKKIQLAERKFLQSLINSKKDRIIGTDIFV